jgi:hypothetical protein
MKPEPKKSEWPKLARGPQGNTAQFQCRSDVPAGWVALGEEGKTPKDSTAPESAELASARADYLAAFDKRPGPKWDAATIRQKIAEKA